MALFQYFNFTPIQWPSDDKFLPEMLSDESLDVLYSPMFVPDSTASNNSMTAEQEWKQGMSYTRIFPKFYIRPFCRSGISGKSGLDYTKLTSSCGLIYFSELSCGAPGYVHGGCLSCAADTILGDFPITRDEKFYFTRTLHVEFVKFVAIKSVIRYDVQAVPTLKKDRTNDVRLHVTFSNPADTSHVHLHAVGVLAPARIKPEKYMFEQRKRGARSVGYEDGWSLQQQRIPIPSKIHNQWWNDEAREVSKKLLHCQGPQRLCLADMFHDFAATMQEQQLPSIYGAGTQLYDCGLNTNFNQPATINAMYQYPMKILRQHYWRTPGTLIPSKLEHRYIAGVYVFTSLCMGPPGRVHGGAIATACDDIQGQLLVRERGFLPASNTIHLNVSFRGPTFMNVPYVMIARMNKMEKDERISRTEGVLLPAEIFFKLDSPFVSCFDVERKKVPNKVCVRTSATWKRPRPEKVGMNKYYDYDESLLFGGGGGGGGGGKRDGGGGIRSDIGYW